MGGRQDTTVSLLPSSGGRQNNQNKEGGSCLFVKEGGGAPASKAESMMGRSAYQDESGH